MNEYSDLKKYQICLQFILRTEKQMSPERNSLQWFIKRLTENYFLNQMKIILKNTKYAIAYYICIKNM